jgi:branched-chain amino acid transport system permease protein
LDLVAHFINGLTLGNVYAIIALGYTMVYGIVRMLNFAHGDVIMVGGYISLIAITSGMHPMFALIMAMVTCAVLGVTIERMAYKPLRNATSLAVLITAIGVSYLLRNSAQLIWGPNTRFYPAIFGNVRFLLFDGRITITLVSIIVVLTSVLIMVGLTWFTNRTRMGMAMRACSEDKAAARLMGINVDLVISVTFAIGAALAAIAGILFLSFSWQLQPTTGAMPGIKAFTAAVFGGIGSIPGAMLGGILLGIIETLGGAYVESRLTDALVFAILIIVLLVRPTGLLGKKTVEKV